MPKKKTLNDIKIIAETIEIKCLSKEYTNSKSKLIWQCSEGHEWESTYQYVFDKKIPCPECRGRNIFNLKLCKKVANDRNGICLSNKYLGGRTELKWSCEKGHIWEATPYEIVTQKHWCNKCSYIKLSEDRRFSIDVAKNIAKERGGVLLSKEYKNSGTKLKWKCSNGHIFYNDLEHIKNRGQWCPKCSTSIGEEICREYFKTIFNNEFPSAYPPWLKNKNGEQLELDGYCEKLQIAFEHLGIQHYEYIKYFHKNKSNLNKIQEHDRIKKELCYLHGIKLIIVPHILNILGLDNIEKYLKEEFKKQNIKFPKFKNIKINIDKLYNKQELIKYQHIAESKGGICLSDKYINAQHKLKWQCEKGHIWEAAPFTIKKGHWCPDCSGRIKRLGELQKIANDKNGKLISKNFKNNSEKLIWECAKGHRWKASYSSIQPSKSSNKKGSWCPICHGTPKKTIKEMKQIARERGGKCLSTIYVDANSKLIWKCKKGHEWEATPSSIINGKKWCPVCSRERARLKKIKYSIKDMKRIANQKGGDCLSKEYIGYTEKLTWKCKNGHLWFATPKNVLKGRWCPICAKKKRIETRYHNKNIK